MDKPTKYFDSARKSCKKTGSGDSSQMSYLTEKLTKLEKKLNKSKKHSKKRTHDSADRRSCNELQSNLIMINHDGAFLCLL